ncbi:hypothetical protein FQN57_006627 [Myotisia sp. PD_48]|nr:hypothetical protein FQN57_006627 [Myotisia sp. PD_48]
MQSARFMIPSRAGCMMVRGWPQFLPPVIRPFSLSVPTTVKQMPPRPTIDESEITGTYLKGSGPGGQKICQATRSRSQNQKIAMRILAQKIEVMEKGDQSREAIVNDVKRKRKASSAKKSKRKYRALEEEKKKKKAEEEAAQPGGEAKEGDAQNPEHENGRKEPNE